MTLKTLFYEIPGNVMPEGNQLYVAADFLTESRLKESGIPLESYIETGFVLLGKTELCSRTPSISIGNHQTCVQILKMINSHNRLMTPEEHRALMTFLWQYPDVHVSGRTKLPYNFKLVIEPLEESLTEYWSYRNDQGCREQFTPHSVATAGETGFIAGLSFLDSVRVREVCDVPPENIRLWRLNPYYIQRPF